MTSSPQADTRTVDIAPADWCWSRLTDADEGLLSYSTPDGRVALTVPYAVTNQQITIPLAPFNCTGWSAVEQESTLEVIGAEAENLRWIVRATGIAQRAGGRSNVLSRPISRRSHPAAGPGWPPIAGSEWLVLSAVHLSGYYETALLPASHPDRPEAIRPEAHRPKAHRPEAHRPEANRPESTRSEFNRGIEP